MKSKPKRGRPPLPEELRLSSMVRVRFTEPERALLERAARKARAETLSDYVRDVLLAQAKEKR